MRQSKYLVPVIIIICCFLTRLPQLLSPALCLDSDECVVAIMSKHMLQGKEFSVFFWGQRYGFSLLEELFIVPFMAIFGVTAIAVKLGMLSLWSIGVLYFYKTLQAIDPRSKKLALVLTLILITFPAWSLWSMKARGGYLTSFTLSSIVLYLLYNKKTEKKALTYFFSGLLLYLIYESQSLWLAGLLPLIAYKLWHDKKFIKALLVPVAIVLCWALFTWYKQTLPVYYQVNAITLDWSLLKANVKRIPFFFYSSMHGTYYLNHEFMPATLCGALAMIFTGFVFLLFVSGIAHLFVSARSKMFFLCSVVFIPLTFFYSLFFEHMQFRYLLPVSGFALLAFYIYLKDHVPGKLFYAHLVILIIAGVGGLLSFRGSQYTRTNPEELRKAIKFFRDNDIKHVYVVDWMLQWDIIFETNEEITARNFHMPARYPQFDTAVDRAYYRGEKTAVFGTSDDRFGLSFNHYEMEGVYFISTNPPKEQLQPLFKMLPQ